MMTKSERIEFLKCCTTKQRREYYGDVSKIGCIICGCETDIHHCYGLQFPAKRPHRPVIPLCYSHHQGMSGIHHGKETFEAVYGDQEYLLTLTEVKLNGEETTEHTTQ